MMQSRNKLLADTEKYITDFFKEHIPTEYVFHDIQHTKNVVEAVLLIGEAFSLTEKELEILQLAAWFHDLGYAEGSEGHEERGCAVAEEFLSQKDYPPEDIDQIKACILATKVPHQPKDLLEEIICDADLSHLGKDIYWDRCGRLRQELVLTKKMLMSEQEWVDFELDFMLQHQYQTEVGTALYNKRKRKHIRQLQKQKMRLNPGTYAPMEVVATSPKGKKKRKKKKKETQLKKVLQDTDMEIKDIRLGRGVETMYRTTYRTHINLSSIADNKANIMLSINAIILSIILGTLVPRFDENPNLIIPTAILLMTCLIAMVFAILATRPKITEGKFTRDDIESRRANLLFFGNFYNMPLMDFHWGMMEMIKDREFLYSSMTKDLYFLGVVLAKKYRFLSICYNVFMFGVIIAVLAFVIAFALKPF